MSWLTDLCCGQPCYDNERWRPVVGWEGLYEVSDNGRVKSLSRRVRIGRAFRTVEGRVLRQGVSLRRYWKVELSSGARTTSVHVHRLVAEAFLAGYGDVVRHLDGDGFHNAATNLAWGSFRDNEADKARHGRVPHGEAHHNAKLTENTVREIRSLHASGISQLQIAASLGIHRGVVGAVVRGRSWAHVT
jgi:hypothetical protein